MTLSEFNAWLEGYSASFIDGCPNVDQWGAIKAKLATVQPVRFDPAKMPEKLGQPVRPSWRDMPVGMSAACADAAYQAKMAS